MYGQEYTTSSEPYWPAPPPPALDLAPTPPRPAVPIPAFVTYAIDPRARAAGIAVLVSAGIVLLAMVTRSWFSAGTDGGAGLLGIEACGAGVCRSMSWFDVPGIPAQIVGSATAALLACAATIALLVHAGVMLLRDQPRQVRLRALATAIAVAFVSVAGFVVSLSVGDATRGLSLGWTTIVGLSGLFAAATTTAFMVRPLRG